VLVLVPLLLAFAPSATAVEPATIALVKAPQVTGVERWGQRLAVSTGTWSPEPSTVTYQWLRNGAPIGGANAATHTLVLADFGKRLSVKVAAHRTGFASAATYTAATGPIDHRVPATRHFTYRIATRGTIKADTKVFAAQAAATFADPRGWRAAGFTFTRVASGGSFTLVLSAASSMPTFGSACSVTWSCRVGRYVVINQNRWLNASPAWNAAGLSLRDYRHLVVNHESGHWLGHGHARCSGAGRPAPVMLPQSKGLDGCRFNAFPLASERWTTR